MNTAEFNVIATRVEKVARAGVGTGDDDQDAVLQFDAPMLIREIAKTHHTQGALALVLLQARIKDPSQDLVVHARQVVEDLLAWVIRVDRLEEQLFAAQRRLNSVELESERLRKDVLAAEGREKVLELELEAERAKSEKPAKGKRAKRGGES